MNRRGFLFGLAASALSAPAIVRAASLMPVRALTQDLLLPGMWEVTGFDMYGEPMAETIEVSTSGALPTGLGLPWATIRDMLLPGLKDVRGQFDIHPPSQWASIFNG
jgi:hypothetical protein